MAVSIQELIEQKEKIQAAKKQQYDLETSIGTITVKKPTRAVVLEAMGLDSVDTDPYIILNATVSPNLKDTSLQESYGCMDPMDVVGKLFDSGEIASISKAIMKCAGYGDDIKTGVHDEVKN